VFKTLPGDGDINASQSINNYHISIQDIDRASFISLYDGFISCTRPFIFVRGSNIKMQTKGNSTIQYKAIKKEAQIRICRKENNLKSCYWK